MADRTRCPFYGFHMAALPGGPVLIDQQGNQCALRAGYKPCLMEIDEAEPAWEACHMLNSPLNLHVIAGLRERARIFPIEKLIAHPQGISFDEWFIERTQQPTGEKGA